MQIRGKPWATSSISLTEIDFCIASQWEFNRGSHVHVFNEKRSMVLAKTNSCRDRILLSAEQSRESSIVVVDHAKID